MVPRKPLVLPRDRFGNPDYCVITKRHTMCNSEVRESDGRPNICNVKENG